jgi:protein-S-isoprenylcysteine O-methyltransferase Ste14
MIFKISWFLLLAIAIIAQFIFGGKLKKKAGIIDNLIVVAPYLIVFGWFSVRDYFGTYKGNLLTQIAGLGFMALGIGGYIVSILFLRHNWAISAAIKEKHTIVGNGPYKYIRHPMYFFMILVILGSGLLISNYLVILYTPIVVCIYYLRAKKEEELLKETFLEYENYIKKTRMLIPGIF